MFTVHHSVLTSLCCFQCYLIYIVTLVMRDMRDSCLKLFASSTLYHRSLINYWVSEERPEQALCVIWLLFHHWLNQLWSRAAEVCLHGGAGHKSFLSRGSLHIVMYFIWGKWIVCFGIYIYCNKCIYLDYEGPKNLKLAIAGSQNMSLVS